MSSRPGSRSLVFYAGLYGGASIVVRLAGFALSFVLARTLSISEYANFGLLYSLQQGVATFALAGIVEAVIGLLNEYRLRGQLSSLFSSANLAMLSVAAATALGSVAVWAVLLRSIDAATYVSALGCGLLLAIASYQSQVVRLEERHLWSFLLTLVPSLGVSAGAFIAFCLYPTVSAFYRGGALGALTCLGFVWADRDSHSRSGANLIEIRRILRRAAPFMGVAFLGWLSGYGNNYVISAVFRPAEVAKFTFSLTLFSLMLLIANSLNQVWSPRFYRVLHEQPYEEVERRNTSFFRLLSCSLGAAGGLVVLLFPWAMQFAGGHLSAFRSLGLQVGLLFAGSVLLTPWWHCYNHFLAHGIGVAVLNITLVTSAVGLCVWVALMLLLGPIGIYIGFPAQMMLRSLGIVMLARRRWPVRISWDGVLLGLAMIGGGWFLSTMRISLVISLSAYGVAIVALVSALRRDVLRAVTA